MDEKGGKTEITITFPDGSETIGVAECSKEDAFNRKLGVKIALGRALYKANEDNMKKNTQLGGSDKKVWGEPSSWDMNLQPVTHKKDEPFWNQIPSPD